MAPWRRKLLAVKGKQPALDEGTAAPRCRSSPLWASKLRTAAFWCLPTAGLPEPAKAKRESLLAVLMARGTQAGNGGPVPPGVQKGSRPGDRPGDRDRQAVLPPPPVQGWPTQVMLTHRMPSGQRRPRNTSVAQDAAWGSL